MTMTEMPALIGPQLVPEEWLPNASLTWYSQKVRTFQGSLAALKKVLPHFTREPFKFGGLENPRADIIIRHSADRAEAAMPVAMVSKSYELIQYTEIWDWLAAALHQQEIWMDMLAGQLVMTEYGERMYLRFLVPPYRLNPGDGNFLQLQVHCWNSVDKSVALQLRLGWYRMICSNGLFFGTEVGRTRRIHQTMQKPVDLPALFAEQFGKIEQEQQRIVGWYRQPVSMDDIVAWADKDLADKWSVSAAARILHICRTGQEAMIQPTRGKLLPHEFKITSLGQVPGMNGPVTNAFQVIQVLSYAVRDCGTLQEQFERISSLPRLVSLLLKDKSSSSTAEN